MTKEDKKARRQALHDFDNRTRKLVNRRVGMFQTPAQVRAITRQVRDRTIAVAVSK